MLKIRQLVFRWKNAARKFWTPRNMITLGIAGVFLACFWGSIAAMSRNWELEIKIAETERELEALELEIEAAELENLYYASDEYLELVARARDGKQLAGEHLVYLPENSDTAKHKHDDDTVTEEETETQSNFAQWWSFLMGG